MSCDFCRAFPERSRRQLDADLEDGKLSLQELSDKYYVSVPMLEEHRRLCVAVLPTTGHELLASLLKEVKSVANGLKNKYDSDSDAYSSAMTHYVSLMRETRELVVASERIKPSDELAQEIIVSILSPLIRQTILITTDEAKLLRQSISEIIPPTKYRSVDTAIKEMLGRFSSRLNIETSDLSDRLRKLLLSGAKPRRSKIDSASDNPDPSSSAVR